MTTVMAKGWMAALFMATMVAAQGQSINGDMDELLGQEDTGNGAPSPSYSAMGSAGFWNRIDAGGPIAPMTLNGLNGLSSSVLMWVTNGGGGFGGFNNPGFSGDFRLLMADGKEVGADIQYHFSGLTAGHYSILLYGGDPSVGAHAANLYVDVPGATVVRQTLTGPVLPNSFVQGTDFTRHELDLQGSTFEIDLSTDGGLGASPYFTGFQFIYSPVPEPTTLFAFAMGLAGLRRVRRNRM